MQAGRQAASQPASQPAFLVSWHSEVAGNIVYGAKLD